MTTPYLGSPHVTAFLAAVEALWPIVGDGKAPDDLRIDASGYLLEPYAVVYGIGTGQFDGSLAADDVQSDAWPVLQTTCMGSTSRQARDLRDRLRAGLLGTYLTVAGRRAGPIRLDLELPIQRDDKPTPALYYAVDRYRIYTTPE